MNENQREGGGRVRKGSDGGGEREREKKVKESSNAAGTCAIFTISVKD